MLEKLGEGGMGVVYAGYDDRLDRRVALKVLHGWAREDAKGARRLWREAQATARLSHPNVVSVHEVGRAEGTVFVVMEFVRGQTLTQWLQSNPRWDAVLEAFVAAGEGLGAAHELGMVHRDFKPSNVMRSDDGSVKVLDFGLALVGPGLMPHGGRASRRGGVPDEAVASVPKAPVGTLPYMSPEQQEGAEVDARSDQYSFCVALWACLTGRLPFGTGAPQAVLNAKLQGPPRWPKKGAPPVPARVVEALRRGLAVDPDRRWRSMRGLLAELRWDPRQKRRQWSLGLAGLALTSVGGLAAQSWAAPPEERCGGAEQKLVGVWDAARKGEAKAAVLGVDHAEAAQAWAHAEAKLDAYAGAWEDMHTAACEAGASGGAESVLDARMRCLHRSRLALEARVDTLSDADAQLVEKVHSVVEGLRPLEWCADEDALAVAQQPPLPRDAAAVASARKAISRSHSERAAGRIDAARAALQEANAALTDVEYGPVLVERTLEAGSVSYARGDYADVERLLAEALELALAHGSDRQRFLAATGLLQLVGSGQLQVSEGLRYWPLIDALSGNDERRTRLNAETMATTLALAHRVAEAEEKFREVIRLNERRFGPANVPPRVHANFGSFLVMQGRYRAAEREYRAALRALEGQRDPELPLVIMTATNLVEALGAQGRSQEAEVEGRKTLQMAESTIGPDHPLTMTLREKLGVVLLSQGRLSDAEIHFRAAIEGVEQKYGPEHVRLANLRGNLGHVFVQQGRYEDAKVEHLESLRISEEWFGPAHPKVATRWMNLGSVEARLGNYPKAEDLLLKSLRIAEATLESDHPDLANVHLVLAELKCEQGLFDEAHPWAEKAWELCRRGDLAPSLRGDSAFALAKTLRSARGAKQDRSRARELAREAVSLYRQHEGGGTGTQKIAEVEAWLRREP